MFRGIEIKKEIDDGGNLELNAFQSQRPLCQDGLEGKQEAYLLHEV
jgi:hypothetical protein